MNLIEECEGNHSKTEVFHDNAPYVLKVVS